MKRITHLFRITLCAALFTAFFSACPESEPPELPRYVMRTPEKYREMKTVIPDGSTKTVAGAGAGGVFVADRAVILGAYEIALFETTWELWQEVYVWAQKNGYSIANAGGEGHGDTGTGGDIWAATTRIIRPVTGITWRDAVVWCNAYSEACGLTPAYYGEDGVTVLRVSENNADSDYSAETAADKAVLKQEKNGFRLPLETEWEFAAHGGSRDAETDWNYRYAGGNTLPELAWFNENAALEGSAFGAHAVGSKKGGANNGANRLGIFDLSGNAAEWCWDWHTAPITPDTPPQGGLPEAPAYRITRGGSWQIAAAACEVKARDKSEPFSSSIDRGFRVTRTIQSDRTAENSGDYPPTLVGTRWYWDSPWGMRILHFRTEDEIDFDNYSTAGGQMHYDRYTYNPSLGKGNITGTYPAGDFKLMNKNKTMHFPTYKNYGHSADFFFMEE
jgi:formylglycine-generating enzyme required for sulfatase activity